MNGNNIIIILDNQQVVGTKADKIQVGVETKNISGPMTGPWKRHKVKRRDWSFATDFLLASGEDMSARAVMVGQVVTVNIYVCGAATAIVGKAICTRADMQFQEGALARGAWQFKGAGAIDIYT